MPVVLIAGLAANHRSWGLQLIDLTKYFKLIALDNRGIGKSTSKIDGLTIRRMALDTDELLSALNFKRIHLVGFSMGAMIALEYAIKRPERVCSLVLSSLPILENSVSFEAFAENLESSLLEGNPKKIFLTLASAFYSEGFLNGRSYEMLAALSERHPAKFPTETISLQIGAIREWHNLKSWKAGCSCPCMMIFGSEDKLVPLREAMDLSSEVFPHAVKKVIQGAGHAVHIEKFKEFNKAASNFLSSQRVRADV